MFSQDREGRVMAKTNKDQNKNQEKNFRMKMMMTATSDE